MSFPSNKAALKRILKAAQRLPLATESYPSRGQTAKQELYQTELGKLFLKYVSSRNHQECRVEPSAGTLAEREYWSCCLARYLGLIVPNLKLLDKLTTVQQWFDLPDAHSYATRQGKLKFHVSNVFDCALFDWLTGQIDRHDANYLYDYVNQQIILIDSAHAFLKYDGSLPDYLRVFELTAQTQVLQKNRNSLVHKKIAQLDKKTLMKLVPLRKSEEISALQKRCAQLSQIKTIQELINLYRM